MTTLQKMLAEIQELDMTEWDYVGGSGETMPTTTLTNAPSYCVVANYTDSSGTPHSVTAVDDSWSDAGSD